MAALVAEKVRYDMPDENGETRRARNARFGMARLNPEDPEIDPDEAYLLEWYWDIDDSRSVGFSGPNPITFADLAGWQVATGNTMTREEIAVIRAIDKAFLEAIAIEQDAQMKRAKERSDISNSGVRR